MIRPLKSNPQQLQFPALDLTQKDWTCQQSIMEGAHRPLALIAKLVTIDTFWEKGSHCLELCTYYYAHQATGVSPESTLTLMFLVKLSRSQNKMNRHEDEKKRFVEKEDRQRYRGLPGVRLVSMYCTHV